MKKIAIIMLLALTLASCTNNQNKKEENKDTTKTEQKVEATNS
jgi:PBP1b-binding outer membrane lipoprotein LpoB